MAELYDSVLAVLAPFVQSPYWTQADWPLLEVVGFVIGAIEFVPAADAYAQKSAQMNRIRMLTHIAASSTPTTWGHTVDLSHHVATSFMGHDISCRSVRVFRPFRNSLMWRVRAEPIAALIWTGGPLSTNR